MSANRKLTTILSADVEGYSRLMGTDEEGTFATLKTFRETLTQHIAAYGGRVVNTWGDGLLAEFPSVVSAVRAAIDAQNELSDRNANIPENARMLHRIGINLGDVIVDGDDIYGDGVNIAARLQAEAPAGGVLISNTVHDQVRNKLSVGFEFLGNLAVKNIAESVPSYSVRLGDGGAGGPVRPAVVKVAPQQGQIVVGGFRVARKVAVFALVAAALTTINVVASPDSFWAKWPLLVLAVIAGLNWAATTRVVDRMLASFSVVALGLISINMLTWGGEFWAIWPLIVLAVTAGVRLVMRRTT